MIKWARHAAWLNATPQSKGAGGKIVREDKTRLETLSAQGSQQVNMPPLDRLGYVADLASEIGIARANPVDWSEIEAYDRMTGCGLTPWEAKTIRKMSLAYVDQSIKSIEPHCLPPHYTDNRTEAERRQQVDESIRRVFGNRSKRK